MPFQYVIKWYLGDIEKITVEAWHRYPTTKKDKEKPAFVIGKLEGNRVLLLRDKIYDIIHKYGSRKYHKTIKISFPPDDPKAIAEAYRIGLSAAVVSNIEDNDSIQKASNYVLDVTDEEIWFWTSKLLNSAIGPQKTISALCIVSGTWEVPKKGGKLNSSIYQKNRESFA